MKKKKKKKKNCNQTIMEKGTNTTLKRKRLGRSYQKKKKTTMA